MKSTHTLNRLVNDVEELLAELKDEHGSEVKELRDRIEAALQSTKAAVAVHGEDFSARVGRYSTRMGRYSTRVGHYVGSLDAYINSYPRVAFATGVLLAGWLGYSAGMSARIRR